ncbi:MAG: hypothetical protein IH614_18485 [Desulfuromonadales bacterium]|nr:hypothetical protein [Desulfuromonadales bacterium]
MVKVGRRFSLLLPLVGIFLLTPVAGYGEGRVFTLWPAIDYRASTEVDYTSLRLLGPFFKYERKGTEREVGLRPLVSYAWDRRSEVAYGEFLYPVGSRKRSRGASSFQALRLLQSDFGQRELGSDNEFMLFPFIFYGESAERGRYFALFPIGGKLHDKFGRDEIRFALFPLYGRTTRGTTTVTNLLWPIFARTEGEEEHGLKFWPLFGASEKEGVYRRQFFLWPIFFADDLRLDTDNPLRRRSAFPFYLQEESPAASSRTVLWPFFSYRHHRAQDYEEWNFPWPLFRVTRGSERQGERFLPLWADERAGSNRKRWFLWPAYRIEELQTEMIERRRDRLFFFLFSTLQEKKIGVPEPLRRTSLWPLFTWEEKGGVTHFHTLSLLEPFFPENEGIQRNWSPLWRLYQRRYDRHGNEISSFLWNLYWKERRGADLAYELFPLVRFQRESGERELQLLKGILRLRQGENGGEARLFYLPWGITWGGDATAEMDADRG